jgi:small acid-soluble spore protein F (minor alpha/beta-type SASP)
VQLGFINPTVSEKIMTDSKLNPKTRKPFLSMRIPPRSVLNAKEEVTDMSGHRSMMSDKLKAEIAKELGVYDTVQQHGWGDVSARNCGNIVRKAIERAEKSVGSS